MLSRAPTLILELINQEYTPQTIQSVGVRLGVSVVP